MNALKKEKDKQITLTRTKDKLDELAQKHRQIKTEILRILELSNNGNFTKARIKTELFNLYLLIK